jgi:hypothetical protein
MSDEDETGSGRVIRGEILPPGTSTMRDLQMPREAPMGIGFLGQARFYAIERVLDARTRTLQAVVRVIEGESEVDRALLGRAISLNELLNVADRLKEEDEDREALGKIKAAKRNLELLKIEEETAAVQRRINITKGDIVEPKPAEKPSVYDAFIASISQIPGIVDAARKVKEDIVAKAGGGELSGEDQDLVSSIDAMVQEFIAKQAEKSR